MIVSTDDDGIAAVAEQHGAEVIWLTAETSGDAASSESVLLDTLDHLRETEACEPELVVFLQANFPLRQPDDVEDAIQLLRSRNADSLFSACPVEGFVWRSVAGSVSAMNYDPRNRPRRQDPRERILEENGSMYIFKPWVLRTFSSRLGGEVIAYEMARLGSLQVDDLADFRLAQDLMALRKSRRREPDPAEARLLARVRLLVLDFDGVMTDNRVLVDQDGREAVYCHRGDGWGIGRLREAGLDVVVLSTETNPVVAARCRKLRIDCVQGCGDKLSALKQIAEMRALDPAEIAYVGNDLNDLECLRWVGVSIAVFDAIPEVRRVAVLVTVRDGGHGAVREVADRILEAWGKTSASVY